MMLQRGRFLHVIEIPGLDTEYVMPRTSIAVDWFKLVMLMVEL